MIMQDSDVRECYVKLLFKFLAIHKYTCINPIQSTSIFISNYKLLFCPFPSFVPLSTISISPIILIILLFRFLPLPLFHLVRFFIVVFCFFLFKCLYLSSNLIIPISSSLCNPLCNSLKCRIHPYRHKSKHCIN